jgi:voltage-gated sodium channel
MPCVLRLAYFRDAWNVFNFVVVGIALIPASGSLAVLRSLCVLRVLRLITRVPSMKRVIGGLLSTQPGLGSVCAIIGLIFFGSAVIATRLYGAAFSEWFGTLGDSVFTLFHVMTQESWAMGMVRPIMEVFPLARIFFLTFILASTFTLLNLFIAVIVNAIQAEHIDVAQHTPVSENELLRHEIAEPCARLDCFRRPAVAARKRR